MAKLATTTPPVHVVIDPGGDLTIVLVKEDIAFDHNGDRQTSEITLATHLVSRIVLKNSSGIRSKSIRWHFEGTTSPIITIQAGSIKGLELCFRLFHDRIIDEMYKILIKDTWEALHVWDYRALDWEVFERR